MDLERLFREAKPMIDTMVDDARGDARELAVMVDALRGRARVRRCSRGDALRAIEGDARVDESVRRRVSGFVSSAAAEEMPIVLVAGDATRAIMDVRRVRRTFSVPGFHVEEAKARARFFVETLRAKADEPEEDWLARAERWANEHLEHRYAQRLRESRWEQEIGWSIAWALGGFQRIDVAEKKAAYFMSTDPGDDPDVLACKPWDAYTIEIPDGLIEVPFAEGIVSFGVISVWHLKDGAQTALIARSRNAERTIIGPRVFPPLPIKLDPDDPAKGPADRAIELIAALAFMTEIRMSARHKEDDIHVPKRRGSGGGDSSGVHRILGPVNIDCRDYVRAYVEGTRKNLTKVQTFVRGHERRVVVGKGRTGRRWHHFPPHMRNLNPDAPVADRPHRIRDD
ncbi:MAG TPA: hypothetical protein VGH28_29660 [Polyangiaceae bacterium]|jgi:hypothetical protein